MQDLSSYLPFFEQLLTEWSRLTLQNVAYAVSLTLAVWLITAIFYSLRISFLKRRISRSEKTRLATQSDLDAAQQELQTLQAALTTASADLEAAQAATDDAEQNAKALEQRVKSGNRQLAESLVSLASVFEITPPNPLNVDDAQAEGVWQQFDEITGKISERFRNELQIKTQLQLANQLETSKLAEKEQLLGILQNRLDEQARKLAEVDAAIEEAKSLRQQQQQAEQQLAALQQQHQAELASVKAATSSSTEIKQSAPLSPALQPAATKPAEIVQPVVATAIEKPASAIVTEQANREPLKTEAPVVKPVAVQPASPVKVKSPATGGKLKSFFGNTIEKFAKLDEKFGGQGKQLVAEEPSASEIVELSSPVVEPIQTPEMTPQPSPAAVAPSSGMADKFKSLLGRKKAK